MVQAADYLIDDTDADVLRQTLLHLAEIGYHETGIVKRLQLADLTALQWRALPVIRKECLDRQEKLDLAIDLFLLQGSLSADEANRLFAIDERDVLFRLGVLTLDETKQVVARTSLFPVGEQLVFSDPAWPTLPHPGQLQVPYDQVMAVGSDSRWLVRATLRRTKDTALDLCTGSGVQALLAASHCRKVTAVDINPRAVRCSQFNAKATGFTNMTVLIGDLYEPIGTEKFDLITANPPFVPSPVDTLCFRDGGPSGETVQRRLIAELPEHLAPGGIAQIVTEFGESDEHPFAERIRSWLKGAPLDLLILRIKTHSALQYAIGHADGEDSYEAFFHSVEAWSDNLKAQGYSRIVSVLLAFQWSDSAAGESWTVSETAEPPSREAGGEIAAMFSAERLARTPDLWDRINHSLIKRDPAIAVMEAGLLDKKTPPKVQAKLLGRALTISHWLYPVEKKVLELMDRPLTAAEFLAATDKENVSREVAEAALRSLLRRQFVFLTPCL